MKNDKKSTKFLGIDINDPVAGGLLLFIVAIVMGVILVIVFQLKQKNQVQTFADCIHRSDSIIQESYPEVCVTSEGKRFVNPDQKVQEPITEAPTSWKSYSNTRYNYRVLYPKEWEIEESYQRETRASITFINNTPLYEGSEIEKVATEISIEALYRGDGNEDESLKKVLLEKSENGFLTFLDSEKTYLVAREEELNAMTELTIKSYNALLSETVAYIDRGDYIFVFNLTAPSKEQEDIDQSYKNIFKQVVLSFSLNEELSPTPTVPQEINPEKVCRDNNGTWLEKYNECEGLEKNICQESNGTYDECESVCRHEPKGVPCILLCVEVCKF